MNLLKTKGEWVLVWSGVSLFLLASIIGFGLQPVWAQTGIPSDIHYLISEAIRTHISQGVHGGALTRTEALLGFSAVQGLVLALVGAVWKAETKKREDQAKALELMRQDLSGLQGDHREFSGEMRSSMRSIESRLDGSTRDSHSMMQNMIDMVGKINDTMQEDLRDLRKTRAS